MIATASQNRPGFPIFRSIGLGSCGVSGEGKGVPDAGEAESFEILYVGGGELGDAVVAQRERGAGALPLPTRHSRSVRFFWRDALYFRVAGNGFDDSGAWIYPEGM